jgi:hypothetical protein
VWGVIVTDHAVVSSYEKRDQERTYMMAASGRGCEDRVCEGEDGTAHKTLNDETNDECRLLE